METDNIKQSCCCSSTNEIAKKPTNNNVKSKSRARRLLSSIYSVSISLFIGLFPKCPMCWAAYMSIFGSYSISKLPYMPWLMPLLIALLGIHLFLLYKNIKNIGKIPFVISALGAIVIIGGKTLFPNNTTIIIVGMLLILSGSLWNSFSPQRIQIASSN